MLQPFWCNSAQIDTFKFGNEWYVMMTYFFHAPPQAFQSKSWRPQIEFMPVVTILMPRKAFRDISLKFSQFLLRQEEPLPPKDPPTDQTQEGGPK